MTSHRAFTLTELLVSMTIGSILLLAAALMLGNTGAGYERIAGGVDSEREARGALNQLAADLANARFHKDGVIEISTAAWPVDKLGFLCLQAPRAQADTNRAADLCAVSYAIGNISVNGRPVRCLMRRCHESAETFTAIKQDELHALLESRDDNCEPVAFGVVSFMARPKVRDAAGQWVDCSPADAGGPEAIDVRLVLARRGLMAKLRRPEDWDGAGAAAIRLGIPSAASRNPDLEVYSALICFGNHEHSPATTP